MTIKEMYDKAMEIHEANEESMEYQVVGIRFENKERAIGESVEASKHNIDREDERDFPEFDSEEYEEMYELDGSSSWGWHSWDDVLLRQFNANGKACDQSPTHHAYLIAGDYSQEDHDEILLDQGEEVVVDAVVLHKFF